MTPGAFWASLIGWLVWQILREKRRDSRHVETVAWDRLTDQQREWLRNELVRDRAPSAEVLEFPTRPTSNGKDAA